jgi:hypothetical protein
MARPATATLNGHEKLLVATVKQALREYDRSRSARIFVNSVVPEAWLARRPRQKKGGAKSAPPKKDDASGASEKV